MNTKNIQAAASHVKISTKKRKVIKSGDGRGAIDPRRERIISYLNASKYKHAALGSSTNKKSSDARISGTSSRQLFRKINLSLISKFVKNNKRPVFTESWDAFTNLIDTWDPQELYTKQTVKALFLDKGDHIIGEVSIKTDQLEKKLLQQLSKIVKENHAKSIIIGQNFPEARIRPSVEEKNNAEKLKIMANKMDISLKDQIIVSEDAYYSYAENGFEYDPL